MSSSSKPGGFRNIPAPPGSKAGNSYSRFIPREELGDFASWKPGAFPSSGPKQGPPEQRAAPAEPSADEWQTRVAAARQAGYQDGYRDGLVALEGFKQGFASQATAHVGALLQAFDEQLTALDAELAQAVARSAVQLARQVLRTELATDPARVAKVAADAVNAVMLSARQITVQVHPQDLPLVAEGAEETLKARGARLLANAQVQRGGVLVDSDVGSIDARIATRWEQAAAALGSTQAWEEADDNPVGDA
jgi:flagellar assembly protein FliH